MFSCVYALWGVCFALVPLDSSGAGIIFVFVQTRSYDTVEEITMLHEIQIEEALRWMVEARNLVVACFFLYCVRRVARASPLGGFALCLSWLPPLSL